MARSRQALATGALEAGVNPAVVLTGKGGHNGFHGQGDPAAASWSDRYVLAWLQRLVG
jgi:predicted alpha/beta-fold hydrolase